MPWLNTVLKFVLGLFSKLAALYVAYKGGQRTQELKQAEDVLDDVSKANKAKSDSDNRGRVRSKYQ